MHESDQVLHDVIATGAHGYVLKSDAGRDLVKAITALCQHQTYFTSDPSPPAFERRSPTTQAGPKTPASLLTTREREILQLLAEGKSNKEVAATLAISVKTVETHRTNIIDKLDVHSLSELVRYAIRNKIIDP
jgi:DNA-binding NarL/FixJ family response regulator